MSEYLTLSYSCMEGYMVGSERIYYETEESCLIQRAVFEPVEPQDADGGVDGADCGHL
jgi:hypothetical protein